MPRQPIYLDQPVIDRLKSYTKEKYGKRRALSIVVQLAVVKYLNEEETKSAKQKQTTKFRGKTF